MKNTYSLMTLLCAASLAFGAVDKLDLTAEKTGTKILKEYSGSPDKHGVLIDYTLGVPAFRRAAYYRGEWWPYGGNRVSSEVLTTADAREGGMFLLLELTDGDYLAVLPLTGEHASTWLHPVDGVFRLKLGTHGAAAVSGNLPVLSWARSSSAYEAVSKVWKLAHQCEQIKGHMKLREEKTYPEMFKYLGWCSWEGYHRHISSDKLVKEFKGLAASGVPIRYFLVDDGHFNLDTIGPHEELFPNGYKPLTDLRTEDGIRWVGMWYALLGRNVAMNPGTPPAIADSMQKMFNGRNVPKADAASIETFLEYMLTFSEKDDIDFVKVDFSGTLLPAYAGVKQGLPLKGFPPTNENAIGNPSAGTTVFARLYQDVVERKFDGLMNCNWHVPHFIFNSGESVVGRCSSDYKLGSAAKAKKHLFESYSASVWIGQTQWGDHDMFHSSDKASARMMAVSKAVSGGPVYLSDKHEELVPSEIDPLCYVDGLLPRPLAPAVPMVEDLFHTYEEARLYGAMAPLANDSAAFVFYNFTDEKGKEMTSTLTPEDYQNASGMMQPYTGKWTVPAEGLVVYDYYKKEAKKLGDAYDVSVTGFSDRLLQVSPVRNGWSVIGRTDKYLPAATVKVTSVSDKKLTLELHESGPFSIWMAEGTPSAKGVKFEDKGNGLFEGQLPVKAGAVTLTIKKG